MLGAFPLNAISDPIDHGSILSIPVRGINISGRLAPAKGEIQRKSRFRTRTDRFGVKNKALDQRVRGEIRYSADQRNFLADQRISER